MLQYTTRADDISGYTYRADVYCPECIIGQLTTNPGAVGTSGVERGMAEKHLDLLARIRGIDRHDEQSFDSGEFPKVIFAADIENEHCYSCRNPLYDDDDPRGWAS